MLYDYDDDDGGNLPDTNDVASSDQPICVSSLVVCVACASCRLWPLSAFRLRSVCRGDVVVVAAAVAVCDLNSVREASDLSIFHIQRRAASSSLPEPRVFPTSHPPFSSRVSNPAVVSKTAAAHGLLYSRSSAVYRRPKTTQRSEYSIREPEPNIAHIIVHHKCWRRRTRRPRTGRPPNHTSHPTHRAKFWQFDVSSTLANFSRVNYIYTSDTNIYRKLHRCEYFYQFMLTRSCIVKWSVRPGWCWVFFIFRF